MSGTSDRNREIGEHHSPTDPLSVESITSFIRTVVSDSPENRLIYIDNSPIFDAPMIGIADGDDPIFEQYLHIIGPHHLTPRKALSAATGLTFEDRHIPLRVICWVLPISDATKRSNAAMTALPSQRWAHTRHYGEQFNDELRKRLEVYLQDHGVAAVAPATSSVFKTLRDAHGKPTSTWSERHALYAAGLGTFGLCDGFLTPVGKAMRCGSVVAALPLPVTPRVHELHNGACTYTSKGKCGACIARCPAHAISASGHDRNKCEQHLKMQLQQVGEPYGVSIAGCGLCQTAVPCESRLPS